MKERTDFVTNSSSSSFMIHMDDCGYQDKHLLLEDVREVLGPAAECASFSYELSPITKNDTAIWAFNALQSDVNVDLFNAGGDSDMLADQAAVYKCMYTDGGVHARKALKRMMKMARSAFKEAFGFVITDKDFYAEFFHRPTWLKCKRNTLLWYRGAKKSYHPVFTKRYAKWRRGMVAKSHSWWDAESDARFERALWKRALTASGYDIEKYGITRGEQIQKADVVVLGGENELGYDTMENLVKKFNIKAYCEHEG